MTDSSHITEIVLKYICPAIGTIICQLMWTAPLKSIREARKKGRLGDLNPVPWAVMTGNCIAWVSYSFIIKNLFVFFSNSTGFIISIWLNMNAIKLLYHDYRNCNDITTPSSLDEGSDNDKHSLDTVDDDQNEQPSSSESSKPKINYLADETAKQKAARHASMLLYREHRIGNDKPIETIGNKSVIDISDGIIDKSNTRNEVTESRQEMLLLTMLTLWTALLTLIVFIPTTLQQKQLAVGIAANVNLCFFYGAPLSTIYTVIKTKSSVTVHRRTMIMNTLNGLFWCAYGIYVVDMIIAVPNGLGALLGFVQGFLCLIFPRN